MSEHVCPRFVCAIALVIPPNLRGCAPQIASGSTIDYGFDVRRFGALSETWIKARYAEIKVIGLSVNAGPNNKEAMLRAGADMLLTKEAAVEELYRSIQEVMPRI